MKPQLVPLYQFRSYCCRQRYADKTKRTATLGLSLRGHTPSKLEEAEGAEGDHSAVEEVECRQAAGVEEPSHQEEVEVEEGYQHHRSFGRAHQALEGVLQIHNQVRRRNSCLERCPFQEL